MPEPEYVIRRGDHGVRIRGVLRDADNVAVDIAGADLKFHVGPVGGGTALLDKDATNEQDVGGEQGEWSFLWAVGDSNLDPGVYVAEVEATFAAPAAEQTFPNIGYIRVRVTREVA